MTLSRTEAEDEINAKLLNAVQSGSVAIIGYVPEIRWQGVELATAPDPTKFWLRQSIEIVQEEQATLSTCEGTPFQKRYTTYGLVFVQLFCPRSLAQAQRNGTMLGELVKSAFRGAATEGGVWFRNATLQTFQPENSYIRLNVVANFEYDTLA